MNKIAPILLAVACILGGFAVMFSAPGTANAELVDRIVARINNQIITYHELKQATTPYLLQNGMEPSALDDPQQREEIFDEVLDELVDRRLLLQEADKLDLSVSDQEVDQWLAYTREQQGLDEQQFRQTIQQYGMSYETYREMIRQNLLKLRIVKVKVGSQVKVSEEEVEKAYSERFGDAGGQSKNIDVRHVLVRPADNSDAEIARAKRDAEAAREMIRSGQSFEEVAEAHSDGPSNDQGGYLGSFGRGELDPQFEEAAFDLEEGELSEVVRTQFGFHVIQVTGVSYKADNNATERKEQLRAQLQQEAVERQLQAYLQNLRARSFVDVKY
ncbi:MAG: peptidylprolyl isomerase [Persicimonas sp.]